MKASNICWNLSGLALPLFVAAVTVPTLITRLGQERFGVLALAWGLIGYASALDLGVGRALTQHVGKLIGRRELTSIHQALMTAARITFVAGLVGGIAIFLAGIAGATRFIKSSSISQHDLTLCMLMLSIALPIQAMSATYKGLNEAFLNFKAISILRIVLGIMNFGGPYLISAYTDNMPAITASLVISRMAAFFVYRKLALQSISKNMTNGSGYSKAIARSLFGFGGWLTVSSVVSPILVQADRFVIAGTISATAVFVYVLPYEMVVQSLIVVGAVSSVIFPELARLIHEKPAEWDAYFKRWMWRVAFLMAFICTSLAILLPTIMPLWIKSSLDPNSIIIGQVLCIGVFANSIGSMFYSLLHAQGKTKSTAKLHLIELPLFICGLFFLIQQFGVIGAAWAWAGRMIFDSTILGVIAKNSNA